MRRLPIFLLAAGLMAGCGGAQAGVSTAPDGGSTPSTTATETRVPQSIAAAAAPSASSTAGPPTPAASRVPLTGDVTAYRGNAARTGVMPGPGPKGDAHIAWQFEAGGAFGSSPVVKDGTVYAVSADGIVHAVDLRSGQERWSARLGAAAGASPLLFGDTLVAAGRDGIVQTFAAADGARRWGVALVGEISGSPAANTDRIVVATQAGLVYAIDGRSGVILWKTSVGGPVTRSVALADGVAYVGTGAEIVAIDVSSGKRLWHVPVATSGSVGTPTAADGLVFAATGLDGEPDALGVAAVKATNGKVVWRYRSPTGAQLYTPAVAEGRAFIVGHDRLLAVLDEMTGEPNSTKEQPSEIEALPALTDGVIYLVGNDGPAMAVDTFDLRRLWTVPIKGVPYSPAVVDGYLVVGTSTGILYAIAGSE